MFKFAVQEVFKCHKATNSGDHIGLLFLSRHLKKYRYGLEYASLEVKNHLERVNFSDLVETIMIMLVHLNIVFPVI
jgi:DNA-directed RNA polymerase-4 subunit 1